ncbi:hypothetical protein R6Q59_015648 [Mikania micrantha]
MGKSWKNGMYSNKLWNENQSPIIITGATSSYETYGIGTVLKGYRIESTEKTIEWNNPSDFSKIKNKKIIGADICIGEKLDWFILYTTDKIPEPTSEIKDTTKGSCSCEEIQFRLNKQTVELKTSLEEDRNSIRNDTKEILRKLRNLDLDDSLKNFKEIINSEFEIVIQNQKRIINRIDELNDETIKEIHENVEKLLKQKENKGLDKNFGLTELEKQRLEKIYEQLDCEETICQLIKRLENKQNKEFNESKEQTKNLGKLQKAVNSLDLEPFNKRLETQKSTMDAQINKIDEVLKENRMNNLILEPIQNILKNIIGIKDTQNVLEMKIDRNYEEILKIKKKKKNWLEQR